MLGRAGAAQKFGREGLTALGCCHSTHYHVFQGGICGAGDRPGNVRVAENDKQEDGAMGGRRYREVTLRRDFGGSTLGPDAWVRETGRLRGHKVWDVGNWKDGLD